MLRLPPELLGIILSLLDKDDLCALIQVSRLIRQLALLSLVSRYNISTHQIQSGSISVPGGAAFLIPIIYRIHPIQRLEVLQASQPLRALPHILAAIPSIPDVRILNPPEPVLDSGVPRLITTLSRNGRDPVVIVGRGIVRVSHHRYLPHINGLLPLRLPTNLSPFTGCNVLSAVLICVRLVALFTVIGIFNAFVLVVWLCRRPFGRPWDQTARIAGDMGTMFMYRNSMRVQIVPVDGGGQFTLVTFGMMSSISITRLPSFSQEQYAAFLTALDLLDDVTTLIVRTDCAIGLAELLDFLRRHPSLRALSLYPGAIRPPLLGAEASSNGQPIQISRLTAPAAYIPQILPIAASLVDLDITLAADGPHLSRALAAIAAFPNGAVNVRKLTLQFTSSLPSRQTLPWRIELDVEADAAVRSVTHLIVIVQFKYGPVDLHGLPRWLARFPALVHLRLLGQSVPLAEQGVLAQAITAARAGMGSGAWEGVHFSWM
ncbi:hypothetical protein DFH09DRAFT_1290069 [Mycena vulgaris]|nr:hypothetical protein DFH09DRAFT_1290069 [Mycena vulgaris]